MYRSYVSEANNQDGRFPDDGSTLWDILDKDRRHGHRNRQFVSSDQSAAAKRRTVRVFVSSTFRDFFSERDILIKKVFPAIREWLAGYRMDLVECDLRWGVPIESTTQQTITACLEELDRYRKETDDQAFFLGLLGDRAGWIPTRKDVGDDLWDRYDWIPGVSITGMEILRGAYWNNNPNACFLIRDRSFLQDVPEEFHADFIEKAGSFADTVIQETKSRVMQKFADRAVTYTCRFRELDEQNTLGVRKVILDGMEKFCEDATNFLKSFIKRFYNLADEPEQKQEEDSLVDEAQVQQDYLEDLLTFTMYGRERECARLLRWIEKGDLADYRAMTNVDSDSEQKTQANKQLVCVKGEPGIGRTFLVVKLIDKLRRQANIRTVYHFCDARGESANVDQISSSILKQAQTLAGVKHEQAQGNDREAVKKALELLGNVNFPVVIIVDGLNYSNGVDSWMPEGPYPPNVFFIATTVNNDKHANSVFSGVGAFESTLEPLDVVTCREWITSFFSNFNKRLDAAQLDSLLSNAAVGNPSWLHLTLEELHVYGEYSTVLRRIQSLPSDTTKLCGEILARVLHDDDTSKMESFLSYLVIAREGLYEKDLSALLGDFQSEPAVALSPLAVAQLKREIRGFTRATSEGQLRIGSLFLRKLIRQRLVPNYEQGKVWHAKLADFYDFARVPHNDYVITRELPNHLLKANLRDRLLRFFRSDRRCRANMVERREYLKDLLCPMVADIQKVPAVMCTFCANSIGKIAPFQPSNSACYLCGMYASYQSSQPAFCNNHGFHYKMGNMLKCALCGNVVMPQMTKPLVMCGFCQTSMIPHGRCCKFLEENDFMFNQLWNNTKSKWLNEYQTENDN